MNREIKFRGYSLHDKRWQWLYGCLLRWRDGATYIFHNEDENEVEVLAETEVAPDTIGQYTGLKDKNGIEIYEGDIIRDIWFNGEEYEAMLQVIYAGHGFCTELFKGNAKAMKNDKVKCAFIYYPKDKGILRTGEVVGNIHDNPELLKGGEQWVG